MFISKRTLGEFSKSLLKALLVVIFDQEDGGKEHKYEPENTIESKY